jgi:hypothetical protein
VISDLYFRGAGLLTESWALGFVCGDPAAVLFPGVEALWLAGARLDTAPWMEEITGPCAGVVPSLTAVL